MGSKEGEGEEDERPQHAVTLTAFYVSIHETTNAQYKRFKADHDGRFDGSTQPVENVSHIDAEAFAAWLNGQGATKGHALPTEAQWEYACRAGSTTRWSCGEDEAKLIEYAWYYANSGRQTHPVGEKKPNGWGLYDMHGNVLEWCRDSYDSSFYQRPAARQTDGANVEASASTRVFRGGSRDLSAKYARSARRYWFQPGLRDFSLGFRLARPVTAR